MTEHQRAGDLMLPEADDDKPDPTQHSHQRLAARSHHRHWEPSRWFAIPGTLWILIVGGLAIWQSPAIWKLAVVVWGGIGLIHMGAWWLQKGQEWRLMLARLYWIGAAVILVLFAALAITQVQG